MLGGGSYLTMNKVLPGAYINFVSKATSATMGERGVVAMPLELDWGDDEQLIQVESADFAENSLYKFGYSVTNDRVMYIRQAMLNAKKLYVYRLNGGGAKATGTTGNVKATALYSGTRGNDISFKVDTNIDNQEKFDILTFIDGEQMDKQTVSKDLSDVKDNKFLTFELAGGQVEQGASKKLENGTNGQTTGQKLTEALGKFELVNFNVLAYMSEDDGNKSVVASFVKRLRYEDGAKVVGVMNNYKADDIGIINVKNGAINSKGETVNAVPWVAGASAGAESNKSLTNTVFPDMVDVDVRYTKSQYEQAIKDGEFCFYAESGTVRVLTDINSLTSVGGDVSEDWKSNRVVRVMDGWANDIAALFGKNYVGKVANSTTGRDLFKSDIISLGLQYQSIGAIENFATADIVVTQGPTKKDVVAECKLQPTDSMEKLYMTVTIV